MLEDNSKAVEIDFKEMISILLRRFWIILIAIIIGGVAAYFISVHAIQDVYVSTSSVYIINRQDESKTTYSDLQTGSQLANDYMILVKSRLITDIVINDYDLNLTHEQLKNMISINSPRDSRILEIAVHHKDPGTAKMLVDSITKVSSEQIVNLMDIDQVNIVEEGNVPSTPSSPNVLKNTIIGAFLGGFVSCFILLLIYVLNDTIRTTDDIDNYLGIATLAVIPVDKKKRKSSRRQQVVSTQH